MPFICDSLIELRRREGMSQFEFGYRLGQYALRMSVTLPYSPERFRRGIFGAGTISRWERGLSNPSIKVLDLLCYYARDRGHEDLQFYRPPKKGELERML